jgi:hypothetical protein
VTSAKTLAGQIISCAFPEFDRHISDKDVAIKFDEARLNFGEVRFDLL